jgi:hypothetical protein
MVVAPGNSYRVSFDLTVNSGGGVTMGLIDTGFTAWKSNTEQFTSTGAKVYDMVVTVGGTWHLGAQTIGHPNDIEIANIQVERLEGNHFADNNLATNDQVPDSPTNNYCTLNPLDFAGSGHALKDGNLEINSGATTVMRSTFGIPPNTGKWYWEVENRDTVDGAHPISNGIASVIDTPSQATPNRAAYIYTDNGANHLLFTYNDYVNVGNSSMASYTGVIAGDITQVAFDSDTGEVWFGLDDAWFSSIGAVTGDPSGGINATYTFPDTLRTMTPTLSHAGVGHHQIYNYGQLGFVYTPPTDFKALNFTNLSAALALDESKYLEGNKGFDAVAYTGTEAELEIPLEFSPALVWIKNRATAYHHYLFDAVRGATIALYSDSADIEASNAQWLKSFDAEGFTLGTGVGVNEINPNVAWCWKEDPVYGLDIVGYEGTGAAHTVAHNLGVVPEMIILKNRDTSEHWLVYHHRLSDANRALYLSLPNAEANSPTFWNTTFPTSSVFTVGTNDIVNRNNDDFVAYLFAGVEGYSKINRYTGTGSADGPYIYTGFRPKYVIIKSMSGVQHWIVFDGERQPHNVMGNLLYPNLVNIEAASSPWIDFLSNGFKIRQADGLVNTSAHNYVFMCFAETPFPWANAR